MALQEFINNNCFIARHIETTKNVMNVHGRSPLNQKTQMSDLQISSLVSFCEKKNIKKLVYGNTAQCFLTAKSISRKLGLDMKVISLSSFNMGKYSGLSPEELLVKNRKLALAMERFRYRTSSYKSSGLSEFIDIDTLQKELNEFKDEFTSECYKDTLFILSNSVIVKLANLALGLKVDSDRYKNIGIANSGIIDFSNWRPSAAQWPEIFHSEIRSSRSNIVISEFLPKISPYNDLKVIIYPGVFGSSRFGPYNLFNRAARRLSDYGISTSVVDPIGSGEAIPTCRSVATEVETMQLLVEKFAGYEKLVVVAHSVSANIAAHQQEFEKACKILISPILDLKKHAEMWNVSGDFITRHGLTFSTDYWASSMELNAEALTDCTILIGDNDTYSNSSELRFDLAHINFRNFNGAGHNFSELNSSNELIDAILERALDFFWDGSAPEN